VPRVEAAVGKVKAVAPRAKAAAGRTKTAEPQTATATGRLKTVLPQAEAPATAAVSPTEADVARKATSKRRSGSS